MYTLLLIQERRKGDSRLLLYPATFQDELMLRHCSENLMNVTPEYWNSTVKPLVNMHGWEWKIEVIEAR